MLLSDILARSTKRFGSLPAVTMRMGYRTVTLTYAQVDELSRKVAVFLQQQGLKKGDCLLVLAPNSPYWVGLFWGCMLAGVVIVPVTMQSTLEMVQRFAKHTEAKLFFKHRLSSFTIPHCTTYDLDVLNELVAACDPTLLKPVTLTSDDLVEILYTSGTTGDPKGTMLTHGNIGSNVAFMKALFNVDGTKERFLSILPLSHIYEQSFGFVMPYSYGVHIIYMHAPSAIRDLLKQYRITKMLAVPEFLKLFMNKIEAGAEEKGRLPMLERMRKLSRFLRWQWLSRLLFRSVLKQFGGKLNAITSGGAPLDPFLERKWQDVGIDIFQGYGLTETSPIVTANRYGVHREGSVGKVLPGVQVRIADDGEVQVKGPSVFKGYFKAPDKTQEAFTDDGWFKTGDVGFFDQDGFLFLKGRKKYMILGSGGQNVYPDDIEMQLNEQPEVKESCVIGLERSGGHVDIHAVLILTDPQLDPRMIVERVNEQLASYQRVNSWTVWADDDFPRSAARKIKKHEVTKIIQDRLAGSPMVHQTARSPLVKILVHLSGKELSAVTPDAKLMQDLALDSLAIVEMVMRIEEAYGVTIDESKLTQTTTVDQLEELIKQGSSSQQKEQLKKWPRSWWAGILRVIGQQLSFLVMRYWVRVEVKGLEHLQGLTHPVLFMPNHTSYYDAMLLARALPASWRARVSFAAGHDVLFGEFKRYAVWAELFFNAFSFPRREQENIKKGLDAAGQMLDAGWHVVIFPEGYISKTGELQELKKGAGLVAVEMGVPVVPVMMHGVQDIFPYDSFNPIKRGVITVTFGKAMTFSKQMSYNDATKKIEQVLQELQSKK